MSSSAASTPRPGVPVRGSRTGHPLMALFDLLGRRWALTVIWALRDEREQTFRELQARTQGIASSVLNTRLRELRNAGIVESGEGGYRLTEHGRSLIAAGAAVVEWADEWAERERGRTAP